MTGKLRKPVHFIPPTRKDIKDLPGDVEDTFGFALLDAQYGDFPAGAKPYGEGLPGKILKLVEDYDGDTYRLAFSLDCSAAVYVLDILKKKSRRGIATPKSDLDRVLKRYKLARKHCEENYGGKTK